jgi:glutathione S-transferase
VLSDIFAKIHAKDRDYFRTSREQRFGMSLEAYGAEREKHLPAFRQSLTPLRTTLAAQPYLAGARPAYADYIVFGSFQWPRCISAFALLETDDPIFAWRERMLDAFDGMGRRGGVSFTVARMERSGMREKNPRFRFAPSGLRSRRREKQMNAVHTGVAGM